MLVSFQLGDKVYFPDHELLQIFHYQLHPSQETGHYIYGYNYSTVFCCSSRLLYYKIINSLGKMESCNRDLSNEVLLENESG